MSELFERELQNTSINDVSLADYVKENYVPMSVIEDIKAEIKGLHDLYKVNIQGHSMSVAQECLDIIDKHTKGEQRC